MVSCHEKTRLPSYPLPSLWVDLYSSSHTSNHTYEEPEPAMDDGKPVPPSTCAVWLDFEKLFKIVKGKKIRYANDVNIKHAVSTYDRQIYQWWNISLLYSFTFMLDPRAKIEGFMLVFLKSYESVSTRKYDATLYLEVFRV